MTETIYKIKRRSDGLFSKGGCDPVFDKRGKIWRHIGHLKSHLNQPDFDRPYKDCEIVVLRVVETQVDTLSLEDLLAENEIRTKARDRALQKRLLNAKRQAAESAVKEAAKE